MALREPDLQVGASWAGAGDRETFIVGRTDKIRAYHCKTDVRWKMAIPRCAHGALRRAQVADWESYWASLTFEIR